MALIEVKWKVDLIESERGWGSKIDDTKYFDEEKDAKDFVRNFNARNVEDTVPDWYMYATEPKMVEAKNIK